MKGCRGRRCTRVVVVDVEVVEVEDVVEVLQKLVRSWGCMAEQRWLRGPDQAAKRNS